jgi:hypothetical protein
MNLLTILNILVIQNPSPPSVALFIEAMGYSSLPPQGPGVFIPRSVVVV